MASFFKKIKKSFTKKDRSSKKQNPFDDKRGMNVKNPSFRMPDVHFSQHEESECTNEAVTNPPPAPSVDRQSYNQAKPAHPTMDAVASAAASSDANRRGITPKIKFAHMMEPDSSSDDSEEEEILDDWGEGFGDEDTDTVVEEEVMRSRYRKISSTEQLIRCSPYLQENVELFRTLYNLEFISEAPTAEIERLLRSHERAEYQPGEFICVQGEVGGEHFFVLVDGEASVTENVVGRKGKTKLLTSIYAGDYFGEMAMVDKDAVRNANIVAKTACTCCLFTKTTFQSCSVIYAQLLAGVEKRKKVRNKRQVSMKLRAAKDVISLSSRLLRQHTPSSVQDTRVLLKGTTKAGEKIVNKYVIREQLGKGSFGTVNLCQDIKSKAMYAIKTMNKDQLRRKRTVGHQESLFDHVRSEIAIMKKLCHPNIINLFEVIDDSRGDKIYLVEEYAAKGTAMKFEDEEGTQATPLDPETARKYFRGVVLALEYLHFQNVIHRDIKPENILVTEDGEAKLADFGVSEMLLGENVENAQKARGTPAFWAPELFSEAGEYSGPATDIYALGVTLYMFLVGIPPFMAGNEYLLGERVQHEEIKYPSAISSHPNLKNLLQKILTKDPSNRISLSDIMLHSWVTNEGSDPMLPQQLELNHRETISSTDVAQAINGVDRLVMGVHLALRMHRKLLEARARIKARRERRASASMMATIEEASTTNNVDDQEEFRRLKSNVLTQLPSIDVDSTEVAGHVLGNESRKRLLAGHDSLSEHDRDILLEQHRTPISSDRANVSIEFMDSPRSSVGSNSIQGEQIRGFLAGNRNSLNDRQQWSSCPPKVASTNSIKLSKEDKDNVTDVSSGDQNLMRRTLSRKDDFLMVTTEVVADNINVTKRKVMFTSKSSSFSVASTIRGTKGHKKRASLKPHKMMSRSFITEDDVSQAKPRAATQSEPCLGLASHDMSNPENLVIEEETAEQLNDLAGKSQKNTVEKPETPRALRKARAVFHAVSALAYLRRKTSNKHSIASKIREQHAEMQKARLKSTSSTENMLSEDDEQVTNVENVDLLFDNSKEEGEETAAMTLKNTNQAKSSSLGLRVSKDWNKDGTLSKALATLDERGIDSIGVDMSDSSSDESSDYSDMEGVEDLDFAFDSLTQNAEVVVDDIELEKMDPISGKFGFVPQVNPTALGPDGQTVMSGRQTNSKLEVRFGAYDTIGLRASMEDQIVSLADMDRSLTGIRSDLGSHAFFAVFDGHNGSATSAALAETLDVAIYKHEHFHDDPASAMKEAFKQVDDDICKKALAEKDFSGSTAIAMLVSRSYDQQVSNGANSSFRRTFSSPPTLYVSNLGDSRAVLSENGRAVALSHDHKPTREDEKQRIEQAGGWVHNGRLNGVIAVSRAKGDVEHKRMLEECWETEFKGLPLSNTADVITRAVKSSDEFVVIACDGIWDVLTSQQVVNFVRRKLLQHRDVQKAAQELAEKALERNSQDNISVIVICLNQRTV